MVRGSAAPEEIAALTAVITATAGRRARSGRSGVHPSRTGWGNAASLLRQTPRHGPGAWRASGRPGGA
ncbi:MAG TPA: acyl-CoA carboxylase subunit epsilon [Streptosporangiaceae bacterium]|nr:acyl-CoA carboxylase subunit epsilon [Streptosporangiaceae bacterium]